MRHLARHRDVAEGERDTSVSVVKGIDVIDGRNLGSIADVVAVKEFLDEILRDAANIFLASLPLALERPTTTGPWRIQTRRGPSSKTALMSSACHRES